MNRPTHCRSGEHLHRYGEKKDCIRCRPVTKPAKTKESKK